MENPAAFTSVVNAALQDAQLNSRDHVSELQILLVEYNICGHFASRAPIQFTLIGLKNICQSLIDITQGVAKSRAGVLDALKEMVSEGIEVSSQLYTRVCRIHKHCFADVEVLINKFNGQFTVSDVDSCFELLNVAKFVTHQFQLCLQHTGNALQTIVKVRDNTIQL